jgi:glycosyltransferase involved in cell wall biosynthesis
VAFIVIGRDVSQPSTRHRIGIYRRMLEDQDIRYIILPFVGIRGLSSVSWSGLRALAAQLAGALKVLRTARRYKTIYLQKAVPGRLMASLLAFERTLIYDFDDAIHEGHPKDRARGATPDPDVVARLHYMLRKAALVIAGSTRLRDYALRYNPRCEVLPPVLDRHEFPPGPPDRASDDSVTLGWVGTSRSDYYLLGLEPVLARLFREFPRLRLRVLAQRMPVFSSFQDRIEFRRWSLETHIQEVRQFDISLCPLTGDAFSLAKGGRVSVRTAMAAGTAVVLSPGGDMEEHIVHGVNALWAMDEDDWYTTIRQLILDPDLRRRIGAEAARTADRAFYADSHFPRFRALIQGRPET